MVRSRPCVRDNTVGARTAHISGANVLTVYTRTFLTRNPISLRSILWRHTANESETTTLGPNSYVSLVLGRSSRVSDAHTPGIYFECTSRGTIDNRLHKMAFCLALPVIPGSKTCAFFLSRFARHTTSRIVAASLIIITRNLSSAEPILFFPLTNPLYLSSSSRP